MMTDAVHAATRHTFVADPSCAPPLPKKKNVGKAPLMIHGEAENMALETPQ